MRWEYQSVPVCEIHGESMDKAWHPNPLDPNIEEWSGSSQLDRVDRSNSYWELALSPRGCWTTIPVALDEWGQESWELVGSTCRSPVIRKEFDYRFLFKRPKE